MIGFEKREQIVIFELSVPKESPHIILYSLGCNLNHTTNQSYLLLKFKKCIHSIDNEDDVYSAIQFLHKNVPFITIDIGSYAILFDVLYT